MNTHINPYFSAEKNYKGQDIVHYGVKITLSKPLEAITADFSRRAQRITEKHEKQPIFEFRHAFDEDLPQLRQLWFDPTDKTFPETTAGRFCLVAINRETQKIEGGIILKKSGENLFLHQLISSEEGKKNGLPTVLVFEAIKKIKSGNYPTLEKKILDIGVSYNPTRYEFFQNFSKERYPIILKKPFYCPTIRFSPFFSFKEEKEYQKPTNGKPFKILPRASYALYALLRHLGLSENDEVLIIKTFWQNDFVSGCVTKTIERVCKWRLPKEGDDIISPNTKAILFLHEFGIVEPDTAFRATYLKERYPDIPLIEDCAWRNMNAFESDYQIYSAQKMFNTNHGGLLVGAQIENENLWEYGVKDFVKEQDFHWGDISAEKRRTLWLAYHKLVMENGMKPDDQCDYEQIVTKKDWVPTVYMQKFETEQEVEEIKMRLEDFGVQAGHYWGRPVLYIPIHQNMSEKDVEYIFAVVRGHYNLCKNYV